MLETLKQLYRAKLLSPAVSGRLLHGALRCGVNLNALLHYGARRFGAAAAVTDEQGAISYAGLYHYCEQLAGALHSVYRLGPGKKVAIMCRNHSLLIKSIFAVSRTGADLYLLNAEISRRQYDALESAHQFDLLIHDDDLSGMLGLSAVAMPVRGTNSIESLVEGMRHAGLKPMKSGRLTVLTGGTTGEFKTATRHASMVNFARPFLDINDKLMLTEARSVYIATPIYHGFGLATVLMAIMLGSHIYLTTQFDAATACRLIETNSVRAVAVVPLMLRRMTSYNAGALRSLATIVSGGDTLDTRLATEVIAKLGPVLYNLYGTSEAGVSLLATPHDLLQRPGTLGRPVKGVRIMLLDALGAEVEEGDPGRLHISSTWATGSPGAWTDTGDLAYRSDGYYYLAGKADDMIVSGGENVYPAELEKILLCHDHVQYAAVIGIPDDEFGQRLKAFVVAKEGITIEENELKDWLSKNAARYQVPRAIVLLPEMPFTALGKPDKKQLS